MPRVHPSAIVDPRAEVADDAVVGPYAVVGEGVVLAHGCVLHPHAVVVGRTRLGAGCTVHPFAVLGGEPQAKRHGGGVARIEAGDRNVFREHVTVHGGTQDRSTLIGSNNLFMVGAHVAHDVVVGSDCVFANGVQLAGHCVVEDWVTFGGLSGAAQHVRVAESAFVAATTACERDVPPFVVVQGHRARVRALNIVGLRRRGVPEESLRELRRAFRTLWLSGRTRQEACRELDSHPDVYVARLVAAVRSAPTR